MTEAWKAEMPHGRKFVLMSLCDNANDQGECFPSVSMIAKRCSMGERTVQGHIHELEKAGILQRNERPGRSTIYMLNPRRFCTPADSAPPQEMHPTPADSAPTPPQISHPTPAEPAPITIKEPSIEPSSNPKKKAPPVFELPEWINRVHWNAWHSCAKRKKATDEQKQMAIEKLKGWREKGEDYAGALENAAVGGWQGLFLPEGRAANARQNKPTGHTGFATKDYREGVSEDGSLV